MTPFTMLVAWGFTFISVRILSIIPIIMAPTTVGSTKPTPPLKDVPPRITAAMASISMPVPLVDWAEPSLAVRITPAIPHISPLSVYAIHSVKRTEIPDRRAASRLPPKA